MIEVEELEISLEFLILQHYQTLRNHMKKYYYDEENPSSLIYSKLEVLVLLMFFISMTLKNDNSNNNKVWQFFVSLNNEEKETSIYPIHIFNEMKSTMNKNEWEDFKELFWFVIWWCIWS